MAILPTMEWIPQCASSMVLQSEISLYLIRFDIFCSELSRSQQYMVYLSDI